MPPEDKEDAKVDGGDGDGDGNGTSNAGKGAGKDPLWDSYLAVIYRLYGTFKTTDLQRSLMRQAKGRKMPASVFLYMLRAKDPRYARTDQYKTRYAAAMKAWNIYHPGERPPKKFAESFSRSELGVQGLTYKIEQLRRTKREYRYMPMLAKQGAAIAGNYEAYRNYRTLYNQALRTFMGRDATRAEQRMMFAADMSEDEMISSLAGVFGGKEAFNWVNEAPLTSRQLLKAAFTNKGINATTQEIQRSQSIAGSFQESENKKFELSLDESGNIVMPRI